MPYLLVRPGLRRVLGESQPTQYEKGLLDGLAVRAGADQPSSLQGVEAITDWLAFA